MALTGQQKRAAQAIVQIFETGSVRGDYGRVTLVRGDSGHLTYGKAQTTLASGNLYFLIRDYCAADGARQASSLESFLPRLERMDTRLDNHRRFKRLLAEAGDDPVMQTTQDAFFDRLYWEPSLRSAEFIGANTALGAAIIYDSRIHGAWHALRDQVITNHGHLTAMGEHGWFETYVLARRDWLAGHDYAALHPTVYRMDAFKGLIEASQWDLALPFTVRGRVISNETLGEVAMPSPRADLPKLRRLLRLTSPPLVGEDIRLLQQVLNDLGWQLTADGIFGSGTDDAIRAFQMREGLTIDGIVGGLTAEALGF